MGRMPLRAPKVLQLSRNPRTWKSLGVILLRLHVFTVHICFFFFLKTSCHVYIIYICLTYVLHMSYICLQVFCFAMFLLKNTSQMRNTAVRGDDLVFHSGALRLSVPSTVESFLGFSTAWMILHKQLVIGHFTCIQLY